MISLAAGSTVTLEVDLIDPSPLNPRQDIDADLSEGLATVGQLEAILVRPHPRDAARFEIANGHRRWAGARKAGLKTLEARIRELTDTEMLDIMLGTGRAGNVKPLTPMDEAHGYESAMRVMSLSQRDVADHFGITHTEVQHRLALLDLSPEAQKAVASGALPARTAWLIARIPDAEKRAEVAPKIMHSPAHEGVMPFAVAKIFIEHHICRTLQGAPFNAKDAALVPEAGACTACPFNSANNRETYDDTPKNTCMSPGCFEKKVAAARSRLIEREEKDGKKRLSPEDNAKIFPKGESGMAWQSNFVELSKRPTSDLLKKEVAAALEEGSKASATLKVPTWRELCAGAGAAVQVWIGFDQQNRAVDLVKLPEALLAADENERAIFNAETIKRYHLDKGAATLKRERGRQLGEGKAAERQVDAESRGQTAEDEASERATEESTARVVLGSVSISGAGIEYVVEPWTARAAACIAAMLEAAPTLPPMLRDHGFQLLREAGASTQTQHAVPTVESSAPPTTSAETLAEWQKAHALEMSPQKIGGTYKATLEDVCGALGLDVLAARNEFSQLRQSAEESFAAAGLHSKDARDRVAKFATSGVTFDDLTTPEQLRALLKMLGRPKEAVAAAQPEDGDAAE